MQAWWCEALEGAGSLRWGEAPTPEPGPGQVRVAVRAASLNFPDLLIVEGKYQFRPPLPFVPGSEFSGTVEAVGQGVAHLALGAPVAVVNGTGGFASHAVVDAARVLPLPPGFDLEHGAAFAFTYGTAYHGLIDRGALRRGETVLVLGAAGGVGSAAVQVAKAAGARVIAAASSDAKCRMCGDLGADELIDYSRQDLRAELKAMTGGKGVDLVVDPVGGALAEPAFRSIAWRGRYLVIGFAAGDVPALPLNLPLLKGASIVGVFLGELLAREPKVAAAAIGQLMTWYGQGLIRPSIDARLPMAELPEAYRRMAAREVRGKLLLVNG